jgi:prepilin-type N-terminal cleavage/methylation domain-containing protein
MTSRLARAFTLVELLLVVLVLAVMASLVVPTLANALAPIAEHVAALLESDLRRARLHSMGTLRPSVLVVGADRDRWWLQPAGPISEDRALEGSLRVLGQGNLAPFTGHRLEVAFAGADAPEGNVVAATFDLEGNRDAREIGFALRPTDAEEPIARWTARPERTRLAARGTGEP